jgi:hypothetical protein
MRVRIGRSNWCAAYRSLTCGRYANPALADEAVGLKLSRFVTSRDVVMDIMTVREVREWTAAWPFPAGKLLGGSLH